MVKFKLIEDSDGFPHSVAVKSDEDGYLVKYFDCRTGDRIEAREMIIMPFETIRKIMDEFGELEFFSRFSEIRKVEYEFQLAENRFYEEQKYYEDVYGNLKTKIFL